MTARANELFGQLDRLITKYPHGLSRLVEPVHDQAARTTYRRADISGTGCLVVHQAVERLHLDRERRQSVGQDVVHLTRYAVAFGEDIGPLALDLSAPLGDSQLGGVLHPRQLAPPGEADSEPGQRSRRGSNDHADRVPGNDRGHRRCCRSGARNGRRWDDVEHADRRHPSQPHHGDPGGAHQCEDPTAAGQQDQARGAEGKLTRCRPISQPVHATPTVRVSTRAVR